MDTVPPPLPTPLWPHPPHCVRADPHSEEELEMCSLKVLEPLGSPTQCLLQLLAERECTLRYLQGCLHRMGHTQACQVLSSAGRDGLVSAGG